MKWKEYEEASMRTVNKSLDKNDKLINSIMGLNGEVGELTDIVKKHLYQGHDLDMNQLKEELGDVLWYIALLTRTLDIDLDQVKIDNVIKLKARYKEEFTVAESLNRQGNTGRI